MSPPKAIRMSEATYFHKILMGTFSIQTEWVMDWCGLPFALGKLVIFNFYCLSRKAVLFTVLKVTDIKKWIQELPSTLSNRRAQGCWRDTELYNAATLVTFWFRIFRMHEALKVKGPWKIECMLHRPNDKCSTHLWKVCLLPRDCTELNPRNCFLP